ncbi:hypothetical protein LCGC14_2932280, partial [marine sediment metagenome]
MERGINDRYSESYVGRSEWDNYRIPFRDIVLLLYTGTS